MPASEHRRAADLLETTADEIEELVAGLVAFHRPDVWTGRRAEHFGRQLVERGRQLRVAADELRQQADEVRARAQILELFPGA